MATVVGWGPVSNDTITLLDPQNPTLVQQSGIYLLHKPSYDKFYVQIVHFSLPWQQGSVGDQFELHYYTMKLADLEKPPVCYKNLEHISCTGRVIANFVFKHLIFVKRKFY